MEISESLKKFITENLYLINENTKESWEKIYNNRFFYLIGEFTKMILDAGINDPAAVIGYIPQYYLYHESKIKHYSIPSNVVSIGKEAFYNCSSLTSIVIPDSITSIGEHAFYGCNSLTNIVLPNSLINISSSAFSYCPKLKNIVIPDSVISIGNYAFSGCDSLISIEIPDSLTTIGQYTFASCNNLKEIQYKGTKNQAIQSGVGNKARKKWREDSSIQKIICTDGEIKLS